MGTSPRPLLEGKPTTALSFFLSSLVFVWLSTYLATLLPLLSALLFRHDSLLPIHQSRLKRLARMERKMVDSGNSWAHTLTSKTPVMQ